MAEKTLGSLFSCLFMDSLLMDNARIEQPPREPNPYKRDPKNRGLVPVSFDGNPWKDNHGNLLLAFTALVCLIGVGILACQQTRFSPPKFPTRLNIEGTEGIGGDVSLAEKTPSAEVTNVQLNILGAGSDDGVMKIAVYASAEGFNDPSQAFDIDRWKIVDGVCSGVWEMPSDVKQVAIAAYHDQNGNDELDRNRLGIPTERYGFSGNARGLTGPPAFKEALVDLTTEPIEISIR